MSGLISRIKSLKLFQLHSLLTDVTSGFSVGILSIPLAIAFAIASGLGPEQGLYAAIVGGGVAAVLGGCRFQISGPASTFILLIGATMQQFGYEGLVLATILAGLILIVMGVARFGALIKFIPYPVIVGFSSGIAIVLALGQIPDLLGLPLQGMPQQFISKCSVIFQAIGGFSPFAIGVSLASIAVMLLFPRFIRKIPGSLVAIVLTTALVKLLHLPVTTIADRFGTMHQVFPPFALPYFEWKLLFELFPTAFAIALIVAIESLLSAIVADGMTGTRHRSNRELVAQGVANICSMLFRGLPSLGSLSRTVVNIRQGGQTPLVAISCSLSLMAILYFFGGLIASIPMATLAGIVFVVAYDICDWRAFKRLFKSPRQDVAVLLTTFFLTVFVNIITALEIGIILATLLFVDHASKNVKSLFLKEAKKDREQREESDAPIIEDIPEEIEVFELTGPLFFAAVDKFKSALRRLKYAPKVLIIRLRYVPSIDASGIRALEDIVKKARRERTEILFSGVSPTLLKILKRSGFTELCGEGAIFPAFEQALTFAKTLCSAPIAVEQEHSLSD